MSQKISKFEEPLICSTRPNSHHKDIVFLTFFWSLSILICYYEPTKNYLQATCEALRNHHWSLFMSQENTFHKITFFTFLHKFSRRGAFVGHTDDECILHSFVSNWKLLYTSLLKWKWSAIFFKKRSFPQKYSLLTSSKSQITIAHVMPM